MSDFTYNEREVNEVKAAFQTYREVEKQALGLGLLGFGFSAYWLPQKFRIPRQATTFTAFMIGALFYNSWVSNERKIYQAVAQRANATVSTRINQLMDL